MKLAGKRMLCLLLAGTLVITAALPAAAAEKEQIPGSLLEQTVLKQTLGTGAPDSLEEGDGITSKGAGLKVLRDCGQVLEISAGWNNQNQGHAEFAAPEDLFKKTAFTLLADVYFTVEPNNNRPAAFTIGTPENGIRALTAAGGLGYGSLASADPQHLVESDPAPVTGWNSLALVYEEKNGGNGSATLYLNGEPTATAEDIGFKLSEATGLQAMIGRSFSTNFLLNGFYDNIVVTDTAMSAEDAKTETAERAAAKEGVSVDDVITPIAIDGEDVDAAAENVNGLTFKGWGVLNGNSTSNLLLDYKSESPDQYWEMMDVLFGGGRPLMTHIKMEMGNDGNNSTGADACTMRSADEEADASRSPGFAMAADAKKINPDVKVSMLYWELPSWVASDWNRDKTGAGYEALYKWFRETIFDAYEKYGYVVDYVNPDKNETSSPDADRIVWFANKLASEEDFPDYFTQEAKEAYHNIKIIASDENGSLNIVPRMRENQELYNAVDAVGFHYRSSATDDYIKMADVDDKEVWYSEACATFGYTELTENRNDPAYGAGTLGGWRSSIAMIDGFLNSFASSRRTLFIFQPAIGAFYEGIQYAHKELLGARDPWSGHIHYDPALYMIGHVSKFAVTGWENEENNAGIWRAIPQASFASYGGSSDAHATPGENGGGSYMTLAAPDKSDFSVVFTNNTQNEKTYQISPNGVAEDTDALQLWETYTDHYMENGGTVPSENGAFTVTVPAYSVVTATTLPAEEASMEPLPSDIKDRDVLDTDGSGRGRETADNYLYADDFEYDEEPQVEVYHLESGDSTATDYLESRGNEPRYMVDSHGAWAVENGRLEQALPSAVSQWNGGDPMAIVGDFRWMNYKAGIDVDFSNVSDGDWGGIGVRSQRGMNWNEDGYTLHIQKDGNWNFYRAGSKLSSGRVTPKSSYRLEVEAKGNLVTARVDGETVSAYTDQTPMEMGRVKLSCAWKNVAFDNFTVETVPGYAPYATAMFDNLDDAMDYEGDWTLQGPGPGSADDWYRTLSWNDESGASATFPIDGTGFMLTGANDGTAKLDVYIDNMDIPVAADAVTLASARHYSAYTYGGLENGSHTVKIVVKSGKLTLDAVYSLGEAAPGGGLEGLQALIDQYKDLAQGDYTDESWTAFAEALAAAQRLIDESEQSQLTIDQAAAALQDAYQKLLARDTPVEITTSLPQIVAVIWDSAVEGLPDKVAVKTADGGSAEADITWNNEAERFSTPFQTVSVTGTVEGGRTTEGAPLTVTIPVEVIPAETVYFLDMGAGDTTPSYTAAKNLLQDSLLNDKADQESDKSVWGHLAANYKTKNGMDSADKTATGVYNDSEKVLTYYLPLEAGSYVITSGHREWWGDQNRKLQSTVQIGDGSEQEIDAMSESLPGSGSEVRLSGTFRLDEPATVTYRIKDINNKGAVASWLAVQKKVGNPVTADENIELGSLSVDRDAAAEDETVTVTATPDQGCRLVEDSLSVYRTDDRDTEVAVTEVSDGVYTFTMPDYAVTVTAQFETIPVPGTPSLSETTLTLEVGGTAVLRVQNTTPGAIISWSSSDESVADVDDDGKITAVAAGSATITADVDGTALTCEVTVEDSGEEKEPSLNKTSLSLKVGASEKLKVQNLPDGVDEKDIVWTSGDEKIATVSDAGLVRAVAAGKATVSADVNGITLTCEVTVEDPGEEKEPSFNKTSLSLKVGASEKLKVQNLPDGVDEKDIVWTSENEKVATVSDTGLVRAVAAGKTTVSADVNGITLTCEVTVTKKSSGGGSSSSGNSSGRVITVIPAPGTPGVSGPSGNNVSVKTEDGKPVVISTPKSGTSPLTAEQTDAMASAGTLNRTVNPDGAWNGRTTGKNNVALVIDTSTAQLQPGNSHQLGISTFVGDGSQKLRVRASREGFVSITPNADGTYTITALRPVEELYILVEILDAGGNVIGHSSMKLTAAPGAEKAAVPNRAATIA